MIRVEETALGHISVTEHTMPVTASNSPCCTAGRTNLRNAVCATNPIDNVPTHGNLKRCQLISNSVGVLPMFKTPTCSDTFELYADVEGIRTRPDMICPNIGINELNGLEFLFPDQEVRVAPPV